MIAHVILWLNEREIEEKKKKRREEKTINREDQISELTFNFYGALSILTFSENELTILTKKSKKKGELRKKKKKSFCLSSNIRKVNLVILISKFSSYES